MSQVSCVSGGHLGVPPSLFHGTDKELHILKTRLMQRNQNWQTGRGLHHEHRKGGVTRLTDAGDMKAKVMDSWRSGGPQTTGGYRPKVKTPFGAHGAPDTEVEKHQPERETRRKSAHFIRTGKELPSGAREEVQRWESSWRLCVRLAVGSPGPSFPVCPFFLIALPSSQ